MKNGTGSQKNLKQLAILAGISTEVLYTIFDTEDTEYYIAHKAEFRRSIVNIKRNLPVMGDYFNLRTEEQKFWLEQFKWTVDFSRVFIPPKPEIGSWRLLILPERLTNNELFARMEQLFECRRYMNNLDTAVPTNARTTKDGHYAVWVHDGIEPDQEFLGESTREADPDMKIGITLLERLTFGIKQFVETGEHLDTKGETRCTGSRGSVGAVPGVGWYPRVGRVCVGWSHVYYADGGRGIRRAVSS